MSTTPVPSPWTSPGAPVLASAAWSEGPVPASDIERMRHAGEGQVEAQAWLVRRVVGPVRTVARALLGAPSDADDAAQKTLLEILRSARSYRGEGSVEAWARRIAVRISLRHARLERRQPTAVALAREDVDRLVAPAEGSPMDALPRPVGEYLAELPEPQHSALLLHHALGYTVGEIAELSEVSPETVRGRLRLGTAALRKRVRQELLLGARKGSP